MVRRRAASEKSDDGLVCANVSGLLVSRCSGHMMECAALSSLLVSQPRGLVPNYRFQERRVRPFSPSFIRQQTWQIRRTCRSSRIPRSACSFCCILMAAGEVEAGAGGDQPAEEYPAATHRDGEQNPGAKLKSDFVSGKTSPDERSPMPPKTHATSCGAAASKPLVSKAGRYVSPLANNAHAMRAILLARAMVATFGWHRETNSPSQALRAGDCCSRHCMMDRAPCTRSLRR